MLRNHHIATWLAALMLLTGCATTVPQPHAPAPPSAAPLPTTAPAATAPTGGPRPALPAPAPPPTWMDAVTHIALTGDGSGWAFAPGTAYRSTDGGANWVASHYINSRAAARAIPELQAFALDRDHAWVTESYIGSKSFTLWATADGGQSWTTTPLESPIDEAFRVDLGFVNPTTGWLLLAGQPGAGQQSKAVLRTNDGGRTWAVAACGCPTMLFPSGSWLSGGMYAGGMAFRDDQHGWATGTYHGADAVPVYATRDGGKTWALQKLPIPTEDMQRGEYGNAFQPRFFGPAGQQGVLPVVLRGGDVLPIVTRDGGQTWRLGGKLPAAQCSSDADCAVVTVDIAHIWVLQKPGNLCRTDDGGTTWRTLPSVPGLMQVAFSSATQGLGFVQGETGQMLVRTSDGGETWTPVAADALATPTGPNARVDGDAIHLTGLDQRMQVSWSPSGKQAVLRTGKGNLWEIHLEASATLLLDLSSSAPALHTLTGINSMARLRFWSEHEVLWQQPDGAGSRLVLRNLTSGQDRELYRFPGPVYSTLRPGDASLPYVRTNSDSQWLEAVAISPVGEVWVGQVATGQAVKVWDQGWLVGRLSQGRTLAVQGAQDHGPLAVIAPDGAVTWLTHDDAYAPAVSPDGAQALWFTASGTPRAGRVYRPLVDTLWRWSGPAPPASLTLGGRYVATGTFSPDGRQVVLALGDQDRLRPSRLALVAGRELRTLHTGETALSVGLFDGQEVVYTEAQAEKTGAPPSYRAVDLTGKEIASGFLNSANVLVQGRNDGLLLHWSGTAAQRLVRWDQCSLADDVTPLDPYALCWEVDGFSLQPLVAPVP